MNPEKAADTVEKEAEFQPHVKKQSLSLY